MVSWATNLDFGEWTNLARKNGVYMRASSESTQARIVLFIA